MTKSIDKFLDDKKNKVQGVIHIQDIEDEIEEAYKKYGQFDGLAMDIPTLDKIVGGLRDGEICLVAGDPNNGKSALAANVAVNVARTQPVLFITLEMLAPAIGTRMRHINSGTIHNLKMMFQAEASINYGDLEGLFETGVGKHKAKLVVIDYLQYLGRGMTPDEVAKMSKKIKDLARKWEIPVMVIVSLRKDMQAKQGKRKWTDIEIDDFMGTGAIGYDADVAMVVSRKDLEMNWDTNRVYVRVIKLRSYPLDYDNNIAILNWDRTKITDPSGDSPLSPATINSIFPN